MLKKTFIALILVAAIGSATYEAHQTSRLRQAVQSIQRRQAPVLEQIQQLRQERDEAIRKLTSLLAANGQLETNPIAAELINLRSEVARLQTVETQKQNDTATSAVAAWLENVEKLKQYAQQHPEKAIPELQFLTDREWLIIAVPGQSQTDFGSAIEDLKNQAIVRFAPVVEDALNKYSLANNGQFPTDLAQLQPYCAANILSILQLRYEIKPAGILPPDAVKNQDIKTDWVVAGKDPVASNTGDHIAIYTDGWAYFW